MWLIAALGVFGCNRSTALPLPGDEPTTIQSVSGIYHPSPFPHVEPNGIQGNWIHITPRGVTTMLWTFRPDSSFEMDVFEATDGRLSQSTPGTYQLSGTQLILDGPFAGKPHVRMTEELQFQGDEVAAPVFRPDPDQAGGWVSKLHIDELDESGQVTSSYDADDRYLIGPNAIGVSVSAEGSVVSGLAAPGGWAVYADYQMTGPGQYDLSLGSVPSWNQLEIFDGGDAMAAPPMVRTF